MFFATLSISNVSPDASPIVILASYTKEGQFQGMLFAQLTGKGKMEVTLPLDNAAGKIACLKAFAVSSFTQMMPLGESVCFPVSA